MKKSNLLNDSSIYLLATIIQSGIQLLFIPYLTRVLPMEEFAKAELFITSYSLFNIIILFGLNTQIFRDVAKNKSPLTGASKNIYRSECYSFLAFNSVVCLLIIAILYSFLGESYEYLLLGAICSTFYVYIVYELSLFQVQRFALKFLCVNLIFSVVNIIVTVVAINFLNFHSEARFLGYLIPSLFFLIFFIKKNNLSYVKYGLSTYWQRISFSFPLLFSSISSWLTESFDKFMLAEMISLDDVAIYSVGYKFGMIMLLLTSAYSRAWMPYVLEYRNDKVKIIKGLLLSMFMILVCCITYLLALGELYNFIVPIEYSLGAGIAVIIAASYSLDGINKLFNAIFIVEGRHRVYVITTVLSGISNIALNYLLIPLYGYSGAAYATLLSFAIALITTLLYIVFITLKGRKSRVVV
ncbi:oligosaccharide flippase family protein [Oceanospirillaceae bacterium]|nr:oligosaccharide flippase family protein [Oceanospirillaceae bacterium]